SYAGDGDPVSRDITILRPRVFGQSWGRAFAVVGGDRITWRNVYAERSSGAAES
ncbi:MAG: right-handed parallel beta-helix repeat-containing protein, partial [Actinomycetota bacterium]|nr:right-handed parallel beta-helix repeat-containing protein [Actinomycetota bacterium]